MKTTANFSVESKTITEFEEVVSQANQSKNRVIEKLMRNYIVAGKEQMGIGAYKEIPMIKCPTCECEYADHPKFADGCPSCKQTQKDVETEREENLPGLEAQKEQITGRLKRDRKAQKEDGLVMKEDVRDKLKKELKEIDNILGAE